MPLNSQKKNKIGMKPLNNIAKDALYIEDNNNKKNVKKTEDSYEPIDIFSNMDEDIEKPYENNEKNEEETNNLNESTTDIVYVKREGRKPKKMTRSQAKKQGIDSSLFLEDYNEDKIRKETGRSKNSKKKSRNKFKRKKENEVLNYRKMGYPKRKDLPVDVEVVDDNTGIYFNVEKYLQYKNKSFITKIIPLHLLDKWTYNKPFFDKHANHLYKEVIEYNKMDSKQQYEFDKKSKFNEVRNYLIVTAIILAIVFIQIIPNSRLRKAKSLMRSGQYQQAYMVYDNTPRKSEIDEFYQQYSLAMGFKDAGNYEKAREELLKLNGLEAEYVDLNLSMNEINYAEAESLYKKGEYSKAADRLKYTQNYKDSMERYYEASYQAVGQLMKEENYKEAMDLLTTIDGYKDIDNKSEAFKEEIYQKAQDKYHIEDYKEAEKLFGYISKANYKDSKTMIYQAQYNMGLQYYQDDDLDKASDELKKVSWFKDASAILNDIYYTRGKALLKTDPASAYDNLISAVSYRDTSELLKSPQVAMFGEFKVDTYNGSSVNNVTLTFDGEYKFYTNQEENSIFEGIVFSNDKESNPYKLSGDEYVIDKSDTTISAQGEDLNHTTVTINRNGQKSELKLTRISPISKTNIDAYTSVKDSLYKYINKKLNNNNNKANNKDKNKKKDKQEKTQKETNSDKKDIKDKEE